MKMEGLTSFMGANKDIKNVYIIGQNYSFGQAVSRAAKEYLARKRPDIKIVGDDLHPLQQTKDFAPFIAKIKHRGASNRGKRPVLEKWILKEPSKRFERKPIGSKTAIVLKHCAIL